MKQHITKITFALSLVLTCLAMIVSAETSAQNPIQLYAEIVFDAEDTLTEGAWSPEGQYLAVTVNDQIHIFDNALSQVAVLTGHTDTVTSVDWNSDGSRLASVSADKTLRIWNTEIGQDYGTQFRVLTEPIEPLFRVRWSPDDTMLATLMLDSTLVEQLDSDHIMYMPWVWDTNTWTVIHHLASSAKGTALEWSLNSEFVIHSGYYGGPYVTFWNVDSGLREHYLLGDPFTLFHDVAMNPDPASNYLSAISSLPYIQTFDTNTYDLHSMVGVLNLSFGVLSWNSSGDFIAVGDVQGDIFIVDFAIGESVVEFSNDHRNEIHDIGWQPQTNVIFTLSNEDKTLRLWNITALPDSDGTPTITPYPSRTPTPLPTLSP